MDLKHKMFLLRCIILAIICLISQLIQANVATTTSTALQCVQKQSKKCIISLEKNGTETELIFPDLSEKTALQIKGGNLSAFDTKICGQLQNLKKLQLGSLGLKKLCLSPEHLEVSAAGNRIEEVEFSHSDSKYKLQILDLRNNALKALTGFHILVNLIEVHLEGNELGFLDWTVFKDMSKLEKLFLNGNKITVMEANEPIILPSLEYLSLEKNNLTSLNVSNWHFDSLVEYDFSSNNLSQVYNLTNQFPSSQVVHLANNEWFCRWLQDTLQHFNKTYVTIKDRDEHCEGITSANICCNPESDILEEDIEWQDQLENLEMGQKVMRTDLESKFSELKMKNELTNLKNQLELIVPAIPDSESNSANKNTQYEQIKHNLLEMNLKADAELKELSLEQVENEKSQRRLSYSVLELRKSLERSKKTIAGMQTQFDQLRAKINKKYQI